MKHAVENMLHAEWNMLQRICFELYETRCRKYAMKYIKRSAGYMKLIA